jgi:hypothetical protein
MAGPVNVERLVAAGLTDDLGVRRATRLAVHDLLEKMPSLKVTQAVLTAVNPDVERLTLQGNTVSGHLDVWYAEGFGQGAELTLAVTCGKSVSGTWSLRSREWFLKLV